MTEVNKKENIREELARVLESLRGAELLDKNGLYADAVSRLYYYVFHGVRTLLLAKGLEPKTHDGALRLLSMHFVKTGEMNQESAHIFARLMKHRGEAEYNPSYVFTGQDYQDFKKQADELFQMIMDNLTHHGYA